MPEYYTRIVHHIDKSKCPHCKSYDIIFFEKEGLFWCKNCKALYEFEEDNIDVNEKV
jgi:ribosomal protein L37AE/L43A